MDGPVDAAADALLWRPGPPDGDRTAALVGAVDAGAVLLLLLLRPVLRWWGRAIGAVLLAGQPAGLRMLRTRQRRPVVECELRPGRGTARFVLHGGAEQVVPFAAFRRIDLTHRGERGARGTRSTPIPAWNPRRPPRPAPPAGRGRRAPSCRRTTWTGCGPSPSGTGCGTTRRSGCRPTDRRACKRSAPGPTGRDASAGPLTL